MESACFSQVSKPASAAGDLQQRQHGRAAAIVGFEIDRYSQTRGAFGQRQTALGLIQIRGLE